MKYPKPFLRWAGGKSWLLPYIRKHIPKKIRKYHEPFLGGGAIFFFMKNQKNAGISDILPDLVNAYQVVRDQPDLLIEKLKFHEQHDSRSHFCFVKSLQHIIEEPVAKAAGFIYLNRTCFFGHYRENSVGEFNNAYGNRKFKTGEENLKRCSETLKDAEIKCRNFTRIKARKGDFVFLDPPPLNCDDSKNKSAFGLYQHLELKEFTQKLSRKKVNWILVHPDGKLIRELYAENSIVPINPKQKNIPKYILIKNT